VAALIALGVVFLLSLLRQGPRGYIGQILAPYGHGGHDHCDDGCADDDRDHDHG
jgi:hypothetical protein